MVGALFEINPKYELLTSLIGEYLTNVTYSNNVNVVVDLKSIIKKIYRTDINTIVSDQTLAVQDISSTIINMIGHYRNFLYKSGKYSTFYILYSTKECEELKKDYPNYKKDFYNKYLHNDKELANLNHIVVSSVKWINILSKYIPNVYFIDTSKYDELVYGYYTLKSFTNLNDFNIILSSDPVMYQLLSQNTVALDMKGLQTSIVTEASVMQYLTKSSTNISGKLLNILLSIIGSQDYSVDKIEGYGFKKGLKLLQELIDSESIVDKTYYACPVKELSHISILKENINKIQDNFKQLYPIHIFFMNEPTLKMDYVLKKPAVTLNQFNELNTNVFVMYPLNIQMLLKGETL